MSNSIILTGCTKNLFSGLQNNAYIWVGSKNEQRRQEISIEMRCLSMPPPTPSPNVQTVSHLNLLSALPSYEGRTAEEGVKWYLKFSPP
jgi:hypothetical protein